MSRQSTKEQMIQLIEQLPADATVDDAMERLYLLYKVERGIGQADVGQKIPQEEARRQMA
jgi:hypothetical protein